jgi:hypothetical protein
MSEKATPPPWEIAPEGTYPTEEGYKILGPSRKTKAGHDVRYYVAQFMTKADAELIVRAQHMNELVEAAKDLLTHSGFDYDPSDFDEDDKAKERRVRTILSKIMGSHE